MLTLTFRYIVDTMFYVYISLFIYIVVSSFVMNIHTNHNVTFVIFSSIYSIRYTQLKNVQVKAIRQMFRNLMLDNFSKGILLAFLGMDGKARAGSSITMFKHKIIVFDTLVICEVDFKPALIKTWPKHVWKKERLNSIKSFGMIL